MASIYANTSVCIRKEFNSRITGLGHQHGRRFIVLEHVTNMAAVTSCENTLFLLHRPDPSHRTFSFCSRKQETKDRYWGQQYCQMERGILLYYFAPTDRSDQTGRSRPPSKLVPNIPVRLNRNGPFHLMYQPKIFGILGRMESAQGVHGTFLCSLPHPFVYFLISGYLLRTPDTANFFRFP